MINCAEAVFLKNSLDLVADITMCREKGHAVAVRLLVVCKKYIVHA